MATKTREQIRQEQEYIAAENARLLAELEEVRLADVAQVRADILRLAAEFEMSPAALIREHKLDAEPGVSIQKRNQKTASAKPVKLYVHPKDSSKTWGGHGKAPGWLEELWTVYERESLRAGETPRRLAQSNGASAH